MQKCCKLLLTLNLIVAFSQSQTTTICIKITEGFPVAHSSCVLNSISRPGLGQNWLFIWILVSHILVQIWSCLVKTLPGCWECYTKKVNGSLHGQSCIHGVSCWCHPVTQFMKSLIGDKQSKRKGQWDNENSSQWSAREKNNLPASACDPTNTPLNKFWIHVAHRLTTKLFAYIHIIG